jgi:hypothetical protein
MRSACAFDRDVLLSGISVNTQSFDTDKPCSTLPLGEKATDKTAPEWPSSVCSDAPSPRMALRIVHGGWRTPTISLGLRVAHLKWNRRYHLSTAQLEN